MLLAVFSFLSLLDSLPICLMNAMRLAHVDGWFFVFVTLTLAVDRLEAFYDNPNALRNYFRDIGRMVLATLGSKNHTTNITKIVTQSIGIIIKRLQSVVSQRESVKNDKPTISMSLSHCIHQTLNSKASTRFHSGGLQQS